MSGYFVISPCFMKIPVLSVNSEESCSTLFADVLLGNARHRWVKRVTLLVGLASLPSGPL